MKTVILAAGLGRRLEPFTRSLPKPLLPIVNRPVMEHIIRRLQSCGVETILSNLYHRPEEIRATFGDGSALGAHLSWKIEDRLSGPAGALLAFSEALAEEDCLVVSGDACTDLDFACLIAQHRKRNAELMVVLKQVQDPGRFGVATLDGEGRIVDFVEKPPIPPEETGLVSCGIYCVSAACRRRIPPGSVYDFGADLIPAMAREGAAVHGFVTQDYWIDVGTPAMLRRANLDVLTGRCRLELPGVEIAPDIRREDELAQPIPTCWEGPLLLGRAVEVGTGAELKGPVVVGDNVRIGANAYVSGSVLLPGAQLSPGDCLLDGILGQKDYREDRRTRR